MKDYYKILGLKANVSPEDIHARWIKLMRKFHPDRGRNKGAEDKRVREINEAYEVLKHPSARAHYDLERNYHRKKRNLYLQRIILPPAILIVLLILALIYLRRPWGTPQPESTFSPALASITKALNDPNAPNDPTAPNALNVINDLNEPNEINDPKESKPSPLVIKAKPSRKNRKPVISSDKFKAPDGLNVLNASNDPNALNDTNHLNDLNHPVVARVKKSPKPQKVAALSTRPKATRAPRAPSRSNNPNVRNDPTFPNVINALNDLNVPNDLNDLNQLSQLTPPSLIATEEEVNQFFAQYRERYDRKDIEGLLSLFSSRAVQNGTDGFHEIKRIYSNFFDESQKLRYVMEDTRIQIYQNAVEVWSRYTIDQTMKGGRKTKVWTGDIRWILLRENGDLRIRFLDFRPQESR